MKTVALLSMLPFALYGIWRALMALQYQAARYKARRVESSRRYDPVFGYHLDGGEPLFLVDPANSRTLFFLEGFRTQSPAGMYRKRFEELFARGTNVVVPVYGLQSSSFELRNRDWRLEEDLRLVRQTYDAYVASLPAGHRVVLCSQSFGALPALAVAASAARRPDALVFLSPHNEGLDFKVSGPVVRWLARQSSWLRFVLRYSMASPAPGRASVWDIADRELNLAVAARGDANPEDSSEYGWKNAQAARFARERLLPGISGYTASVVWGGQDLYFSQQGFSSFASALAKNNAVSPLALERSGHMVLLDAQADEAWGVIDTMFRV